MDTTAQSAAQSPAQAAPGRADSNADVATARCVASPLHPTPHPPWLMAVLRETSDAWTAVARHRYFAEMGTGRLDTEPFQCGLVHFYPIIEAFPRWLDVLISRIPPTARGNLAMAREWLMSNRLIERMHTRWWRDWATGFGVPKGRLKSVGTSPRAFREFYIALEDSCQTACLPAAIAALNVGVEGPTGEWTRWVQAGLPSYAGRGGFRVDPATLRWVEMHARYDDDHPWQAIELVKLLARDPAERDEVHRRLSVTLHRYELALSACYDRRRGPG